MHSLSTVALWVIQEKNLSLNIYLGFIIGESILERMKKIEQ